MALFEIRRWLSERSHPNRSARRLRHKLLRLERMEERAVPATFTVTNTLDSGAGSLRAAILSANSTLGADVIDATGVSGTISLLTVLPNISDDTTLNGSGAANLTVRRDATAANFRIFNVQRAGGTKINVTLNGLTVSNGNASNGGGIQTNGEHVVIDRCVISNNVSPGVGGGLSSRSNTDLTVMNSTISGNSASSNGGGFYAGYHGFFLLLNSTVSGNTSGGTGGGLYFYGSVGTGGYQNWVLKNSTISGNVLTGTPVSGAGITMYGNSNILTAQNCTITANQSLYGGGIFADKATDQIRLESTIISGNLSNSPGADIEAAGTVTAKNSAIGDASGFTLTDLGGNLAPGTALNLGPLANNGGPTQTHLPGAGSPLINAGFNAVVQGVDQRGFQRTFGSQVDIGAVEAGASLPAGNIPAVDIVTAAGATSYQVKVIYTDDTAVNVSTIDTSDITISGPAPVTITGVTVSPAGNGTPRTATYTITPPGGSWDLADNGTYVVSSVAGQVTDTSGNPVTAGIIGQFKVSLIVVTNTNDSGAGSLRQAILDADAVTGFKPTIGFAIGTGVATIHPASPLPAITTPMVIDGTSQPGYAGHPIIEIAGDLAGGNGLTVNASNSLIQGLSIDRFANGAAILISGTASGDVVQGNYLGLNPAGAAGPGNSVGIELTGQLNNNLIGSNLDGSNDAAERNVISGNTAAGVRTVLLTAPVQQFQWTTGTGANGHYYVVTPPVSWTTGENLAVANGGHLASIGSHDEQVFVATGGPLAAANNDGWLGGTDDPAFGGSESGNTSASTSDAAGTRGQGWVWTDGTTPMWPVPPGYQNFNAGEPNNAGSGENQLEITGGTGQGTGGDDNAPGAWNDNNQANGNRPAIMEFTTAPNLGALETQFGFVPSAVQGNYIGTDPTGNSAVGNGAGVDVGGSLFVTVKGNVISGNTGAGVSVSSAPNLPVTQWSTGAGGNGHFYVVTPVTTWQAAETAAVAAGGHLASIGSQAENDFLHNNITPQVNANAWVGGTNLAAYGGTDNGAGSGGNGYVWTDGTTPPFPTPPGYANWDAGEPNDAGGNQHSIQLYTTGKWDDDNPASGRPAIMEFTSPPNLAALGNLFRSAGGGNHTITGNTIGVAANGTTALANGGPGISVDDTAGVVIGGTAAGAANTIRNNTGAGVAVTGNGAKAIVRGNSIFANGGLGIDLGSAGVTPNDALDGDTGPNGLQNFPVLTTVATGATTTVSGSINSTPNTVLTLDFYASAAADASGNGEGQRYLGSTTVTTDAMGNMTFTNVSLPGSSTVGEFISATATDPLGNTSEFAADAATGAAAPTVASVAANGGGIQRSEVRNIVVTFSTTVNFAGGNGNAAAAFTLSRIGGGAVGLAAAVTTVLGQTMVTLTFTGTAEIDPVSTQNGGQRSLADGRYHLSIADGAVTDATTGLALDGDGNGTAGGAYNSADDTAGSGPGYHLGLYRLFGDATGNGTVDLLDLSQLRSAFNSTGPGSPYVSYLDADNSNQIDLIDLGQFRLRFNVNLF